MPYDALGNYVPGDEVSPLTIEDMRYALSKRSSNPYTYSDVFGGIAKGAVSNLESLARGAAAVVPASLGELESMGRHVANFSFGPGGVKVPTQTYLPTTEDVLKAMPQRVTPARPESAGMEMLGAALNLPGQEFGIVAPFRALASIPGAIKHGAQEFVKASVAGAPHAVKSKGGAPGNWITSLGLPLEDYPGMLGAHVNEQTLVSRFPQGSVEDLRYEAYNNWLRGPYLKYITNEMGSGVETDSLVRLAEKEGIHVGHNLIPLTTSEVVESAKRNRELWAGEHGKQTATTELGKLVEDASDASISIHDKSHIDPELFPYVNKLKEGQPIYDLENLGYSTVMSGLADVRNHARDMILSGKVKPEDVSKFTIETAARDLWGTKNSAIAKANRDQELYKKWKAERQQTIPAAMTFDDGSKVVLFDGSYPEDMLARDMSVDTKDLNICVVSAGHGTSEYPNRHVPVVEPHTGEIPNDLRLKGEVKEKYGYLENVRNGRTHVASVRDPQGNAQATIDIYPTQDADGKDFWDVTQIVGKENGPVADAYVPKVKDFLNANADKILNLDSSTLRYTNLFSLTNDKVTVRRLEDLPNFNPSNFEEYMRMRQMDSAYALEYTTMQEVAKLTGQSLDQINPEGDLFLWYTFGENHIPGIKQKFLDIGMEPHQASALANWYGARAKKIEKEDINYLLKGEVPRFFSKEDLNQAMEAHGLSLFKNPSDQEKLLSDAYNKLRTVREQLYTANLGDITSAQVLEMGRLEDEYHRLALKTEGQAMPRAEFHDARSEVIRLLENMNTFFDLRNLERWAESEFLDVMSPSQYSSIRSLIDLKLSTLLGQRERRFKDGGQVNKEDTPALSDWELIRLERYMAERPEFHAESKDYDYTPDTAIDRDAQVPQRSTFDALQKTPFEEENWMYKNYLRKHHMQTFAKGGKTESSYGNTIEEMKYALMKGGR